MQQNSMPNILIFMTDQQRGDTALQSCDDPYLGGSKALIPNLDAFRSRGVSFTEAYCPSPHCCPSRATFMTGLYPTQHGIWNNVNVHNALSTGLSEGLRLWSEDLKELGYRLDYSGKWHVSAEEGPRHRGWREGMVTANATKKRGNISWEDYRMLARERESRPEDIIPLDEKNNPISDSRPDGDILRPGYPRYSHYGIDEDQLHDSAVVEDAVRIIRERSNEAPQDRPWCQYVGTIGPHDPYKVPKKFLDMYSLEDIQLPPNFYDDMEDKNRLSMRTKWRFEQFSEEEHRRAILHYLALCSYEDHLFGRILEALEENDQLDNTLIMYVSDHGDYMGDHGLWCKGLPPFKNAYHIPLIVSWEGIENPGRSVDALVSIADIAPTIMDLAGAEDSREARGYVGRSLLDFLKNRNPQEWRIELYTQTNGNELYGIQRMVFDKKWKLVYNGFDLDELYDLENDPGELHNIYDQKRYGDIIRHYSRKLQHFAMETGDQAVNPYIMVGLAAYGPGFAFTE